MRVNELKLTNVRSIRTAELHFQQGFNLVVGDNGVGKTTVLETLAVCLSEYVRAYNNHGAVNSFAEATIRANAESLDVGCQFGHAGSSYSFVVHKPRGKSTTRPERYEFIGALPPVDPGVHGRQPETDGLEAEGRPLAVMYTTTRAVASERRPKLPIGGTLRAYEDALSDRSVRLGYFASWMKVKQEFNVERNKRMLHSLEHTVQRFLPGYGNLHRGGSDEHTLLINRHGAPLQVRHLSHGERAILAVVVDLTRRLGEANPELQDPATEAGAVVLIDEIDLHLHPKRQREIARKLTETFPRCQFIATTHSPQVIGEVEHDRIQILTEDGAFSPTHSFGVDASRVLEEIMEAEPRNHEVRELLSRASHFIDRERFKEARELLGKLNERLGSNDPDVTGLGTLLDFVEGED